MKELVDSNIYPEGAEDLGSFRSDIFEVIGKTGKYSFILAFSGGKIGGI